MPLSRRKLGAGEDPMDWESESEKDEEPIKVLPLLSVPPSLANPNDKLCDTCEALELTPRCFVVLPGDSDADKKKTNDNDINLGSFKDVMKRSHGCPLCRLVLKALAHDDITEVENGEPVPILMGWTTDGHKQDQKSRSSHIPKTLFFRPYDDPKRRSTSKDLSKTNTFSEITLLANDAPTASKSLFARLIGEQIDFNMVRNWLAMCNTGHGYLCDQSEMFDHNVNDPATEPPTLRLIDVVDNCIIHAPHHCKYVGLSYVWGKIDVSTILRLLKGNVEALKTPGSLLQEEYYKRIPVTIRDAMQVVRELHLRYLWADNLCIIQDDDGEQGSKYGTMAKMDLIYGAAYLTIVAATGNDANAGLPGLHPGTRGVTQSVEEVAPEFRLALKFRYQDYIPHSVYWSRGWTYQEHLFSTRKLTFIGGQVVYSCRRTDGWPEDLVPEDQHNENNRVIDSQDEARSDTDSQNEASDNIDRFEGLISTYSGRSLGFESDIYNAFAGIARYFQTNLKANLCHGIPDKFFDWFLLWKPQGSQIRRKNAPSWSWSGWHGASSTNISSWFGCSIIGIRYALRSRTWVIWYQRKAHDSTECVQVWTPKFDLTSPPRSPRNFYGGLVEDRFSFDCTQTTPTPKTLTGAPTYIKDAYHPNPGSGFLQFWTVSAIFRVAKPVSKNKESKPTNGYTRLGIFREKDREVGIIFIHSRWCKKHVPSTQEFILVCEGSDKTRNGQDNDDDEPQWRYMVMLIEWHEGWAERVAVGWIKRRFLKQALNGGAAWKEIILG